MNKFKDNDQFWAFIVIILAIIGLVVFSSGFNPAPSNDITAQAKIRIIDGAVTGLMAILGMAAQALFKTNQVDRDLASAAKASAEKIPPLTGEAAQEIKNV